MQVYRGMDVGTAKPGREERQRIPHHLIDVVDVTEPFDAAKFVVLAKAAEAGIHARGRTAIICGGTGLYIKALLCGLGEAPASDSALRKELESAPLPELLEELAREDPETFERIDRQNPRRVIRALEVIRLSGRPYSEQRSKWQEAEGSTPANLFGIARAPTELRTRIDVRVDEMFAQGLVDETRHLLDRGLDKNPTAMQALGYRQVVEHLHGVRDLAATIELVKIKTRQFAKRQMTWFRRQLEVEWIDGTEEMVEKLPNSKHQTPKKFQPSKFQK